MLPLEVGKLYSCSDFLLLFPDKEAASSARRNDTAATAVVVDAGAVSTATYWSRKLGKSVSYTVKNIPLLVLNNKEEYVEVLAEDRKGWIINEDYLDIKEII
ncbi:MAG: hypothetical protein EB023_06205 [Flavobacteriia bacterium]|nr:hypothetical protein [Flavobacteriia bacterium]